MKLYNKDIDYDLYLDGKLVIGWFEADIELGKIWVDTPVIRPGDQPYKVLRGKVEIKIRIKRDYNADRGRMY